MQYNFGDMRGYAAQIAGLFGEDVNSYWIEVARCMVAHQERRRNILFRLPSGNTVKYTVIRAYVLRCVHSEGGLEHMDGTVNAFIHRSFPEAGSDAPDIETLCYDLYTISGEDRI